MAYLPALQAAVADAQRRCQPPDGILLTGDLVQDDPDGYRWVRQVFGASPRAGAVPAPAITTCPITCAPRCAARRSSRRPHEFGRWLVVMLDSWVANNAGGASAPSS